ncbi:hypothetical protein CBM2633_B11177 [Cupriavidus taiwanensis]|nr:hypothetical protein CBM2633_B11177 [Cupriavidus taiwanensis]
MQWGRKGSGEEAQACRKLQVESRVQPYHTPALVGHRAFPLHLCPCRGGAVRAAGATV